MNVAELLMKPRAQLNKHQSETAVSVNLGG